MKIKARSHQKLKNNLRWDMLLLLDQIEEQGEYSNLAIDQYLSQTKRSEPDSNLVVKVVYGSLQRRLTLDYYLKDFLKGKIESWVRSLLRLSIYQALYLDRVPQHAIVNEAVEIAKVNGHQGIANLVNGVLRNFFRQPLKALDQIADPLERLSIQYSLPQWLVVYFQKHLSPDSLQAFLASLNQRPHLSARINGLADQRSELQRELHDQGCRVTLSQVSPYGVRIESGPALSSPAFKAGHFTIQDESSMLVAPLGKLQGDERVLDACAAPGGKATHIASFLTSGRLTALDISARKLNILSQHAQRMGLVDKIKIRATDALKFEPDSKKPFDVIYLDAPCSGIGLMRRKPEIKYLKDYDQVLELAELQEQLFDHLLSLLKAGGRLIYSTCTLTYEENEELVAKLLAKHSNLEIEAIQSHEVLQEDLLTNQGFIRVWPHQFETDGFFISRFIKN